MAWNLTLNEAGLRRVVVFLPKDMRADHWLAEQLPGAPSWWHSMNDLDAGCRVQTLTSSHMWGGGFCHLEGDCYAEAGWRRRLGAPVNQSKIGSFPAPKILRTWHLAWLNLLE
jgi:hypothetical protein